VKIEGRNACRLTDKKFQNHGNTADLGGTEGAPVPVPDNFEKVLCGFLKRCTQKHDSQFPEGKPDKQWCKQPSTNSRYPDRGAERGARIGECCENEIKGVKLRSASDFSQTVQAEQWIKVPELGGHCRPDVIAGTPPHCTGVWDFKTNCPPLPPDAPPPQWHIYGDGSRFTRKTDNASWYGCRQSDIYRKACGTASVMIHENSEACN